MSNVVSINADVEREAIFAKHGITPEGTYVEDVDNDDDDLTDE